MQYQIFGTIILASLLGACAGATAPEPPSSVSSTTTQANAGAAKQSVAPTASPAGDAKLPDIAGGANSQLPDVTYKIGAQVGSREMRQKVNDCNVKGFFYDRVKLLCDTTLPLVNGLDCTHDGVAKSPDFNADRVTQLDAFIATLIAPKYKPPYLFDQCVQVNPSYWSLHIVNADLQDIVACVPSATGTAKCPGS